MANLLQDLKYGVRTLAKNPGFAAVAVLTLALGIGANTAIFTVVNAVLLRPLAFHDPSRVVLVVEVSRYPITSTSYENYEDWRDQSRSFESMQASCFTNVTLTGMGDPERLTARRTTAGFFPLLGIEPVAGRTFLAEEDAAGGAPVVLISYALWQRRFGGSRDWLGKTIDLDSQPYTLVGVLPPGFQFLQSADVFIPFEPWAKTLPDDRDWHPGIIPVARLKAGVTLEQARAEMKTITQRLEKQHPEADTGVSADVVHLQDQIVQNVRPALIVLLCAVGFILLIACVNIANLLLARAASRTKEVAIRTALGASRNRIAAQLLTESVLIAVAGGALGLLLAYAALGQHEIGIRMTLGAQPLQVFQLITGQGLRLALLGVAIGCAASLALTRVLRSFLYNVSALDAVTYLAVAGLLVAVGLLASYLPARRATKVDPLVALRYE